MKKRLLNLVAVLGCVSCINAQETTVNRDTVITTNAGVILTNTKPIKYESPYKTSWKVDAPIIGGGIGLTALGVSLIQKKDDLTMAELATRTPDKVPGFDRHSAGDYSEKADKDSYIPFQASFAFPVVLGLIDKKQRHNVLQVYTMYLETMAITGAMFTMTTGTIHRSRPLVYGDKAPLDKRLSAKSQRSFFAGHTAATAAASFFAAKVFSDFNPDSKLKPVVWTVAAATPALVGYLRYRAGMHFLSDNLLGYGLGAATGILVPHLHKKKILNQNVSITPTMGVDGSKGISLAYRF